MFIKVNTANLNECSNWILDKDKKIVKEKREITKINIVKKYLLISDLSVLESVKETLLKYICLGFVWDNKLFKENLIKLKTLINLKPELVEKKDPPIITNNKNMNDKFVETLLNEIPILETLLHIDTSVIKKLLS